MGGCPMPSVAIVGAGPAGLTLARLLQRRGVSVRVFEGDATQAARRQGGSLDLHEEQLATRPVAEGIATYDANMLARMRTAISETLAAQDLMIAEDAPRGIVDHVQRPRS